MGIRKFATIEKGHDTGWQFPKARFIIHDLIVRSVDPGDLIREVREGVEIDVSVTPNSTRSGIEGVDRWRNRLVVKLQAVPKDGRANRELCEDLNEVFSAPVTLLRGQTSRAKTVLVRSDRESVLAALEGLI